MVALRAVLALSALLLFALPAFAVSPAGPQTDAAGDQENTGLLFALQGTPLACRDPASDVVASNVTLDADSLDVAITMDDLSGSPHCGPVPLPAGERAGIVHVYLDYTCSPTCLNATGHYVAIQHDLSGTTCVSIYSPQHGSSHGCTDLGGAAAVSGDTLSWSIPRSGTYSDEAGSASYSFDGPVCYYGVTSAGVPSGIALATLEDTYAWHDPSQCAT